jgi:predicted dehydrogenase
MNIKKQNRRNFLKTTGASATVLSGLSTGVFTSVEAKASTAPSEKLNIACVGTANRAAADIAGVKGENIVAICDIDSSYLNRAAEQFPDARKYEDYRELIDQEGDRIDAVVVATADHSHAPAALRAIRAGKHTYTEKPLSHTVFEARLIASEAAKYGVATQLGTQIHATDNYRRVVEAIGSGVLGKITDVHVWVGKGWGGGDLPTKDQITAAPSNLNWDLWLGPAEERPYAPGRYHPANWRRWWAFGQGTLGDMACHYMDLPFWALGLRHPISCKATGPEVHAETCPLGLKVEYVFPKTDKHEQLNFTWYDGNMIPKEIEGQRVPGAGVMFIGEEGMMFANYGSYRLFPTDKFSGWTPPTQTIAKSIGHHAEWIKACKDGSPTSCNFDYSGALTETVLLGNVAYRTGEALEWDAKSLTATNCPAAAKYLTKEYRKGFEIL